MPLAYTLPENTPSEPPAALSPGKLAKKAYGSATDEEEMLRKYMPLLHSEVNHVSASLPPNFDFSDLVSAGLVGLVQAYRRYDSSSGVPFAAYASRRIRGAIMDELRRSDWMTRSARAKAKIISEAIRQFEQTHGRPATDEEIAEELGMELSDYAQLLDEVRPISFVELDALPAKGGEESLHEILPDEGAESADETVNRKELAALVAQRIQQMPPSTRKILAMYYFEDMRLAEIAKVFGVSESRICQIHTHAILSLRSYMQSLLNS